MAEAPPQAGSIVRREDGGGPPERRPLVARLLRQEPGFLVGEVTCHLGLTPQAPRCRPFGAEFIAGRLSGWIPFQIVGCWGATSRASPEGATA